ncbi:MULTISPECIES: PepSY domain-containing protein [unclassified Methylobacterium]|jgi:Peptidase propeptide and YPEB domain|uniref:PepSY domain-containing protein n=1 Tax=unclassified Methylobacterium TaxID=2615210 RepID=UPI0013532046|nr:PepSY domain-containing protein [Methylobacterium sp. 2A]MWV24723.1 PepSY domain-containing protein [Methylobacterium sp. 2A]
MESAARVSLPVAPALGCVEPALARKDGPGPDRMPVERVKRMLFEAGCTSVIRVRADDGHREGEGLKTGVPMEVHVDPRTGAVTGEKPDDDDD